MPPTYPNGVITRYSIKCGETNIDDFDVNESDNKMTGIIKGLSPDAVYVLQMKAHTRVGPGPPLVSSVKTSKLLTNAINNDKTYVCS